MSAEEALKYGLIDEIVQPNDEKLKMMALPPPGQAPQLFGEMPADAADYEFGKLVRYLRLYLSDYVFLTALFSNRTSPNRATDHRLVAVTVAKF